MYITLVWGKIGGFWARGEVINLARCQNNPCYDSDGLKTAPDGLFFPRLIKIWLYWQGGDIYIGELYVHSFSGGMGKLIGSYIILLVVNMKGISRRQGQGP